MNTEPLDPRFDTPPLPIETLWRLVMPLRLWHRPRLLGLENVSVNKPTLFVGNHTLFGLLDGPLLGLALYRQSGVHFRVLADRIHFQIPGWGSALRRLGCVEGSRETCADLMRAGQHLLVYPGGWREVAKRRGEAYQLLWKQRTGFVRMAIQEGYSLTPVASVGPEECYDILLDGDDVMTSPLGRLLRRSGLAERFLRDGDTLLPLARGLGPTPFPRPERFYFSFGAPIGTQALEGKHDDPETLFAIRNQVATSLRTQIQQMQALRRRDRRGGLWAELRALAQGSGASAPAAAVA